MRNRQHEYDQASVVDVVDDPEVADAHTPCAAAVDEHARCRRSRLLSEQLDRGLHSASGLRVELPQLTQRRGSDVDPAGHRSPSSALTSSHGIGVAAVSSSSRRALNQMGGPGLWDDYMVWATTNALASPSMVKPQPGNKNCYTTPISVYRTVDGKPKFWKVFNPSVVVSVNNKKVITSIPTTTTNC